MSCFTNMIFISIFELIDNTLCNFSGFIHLFKSKNDFFSSINTKNWSIQLEFTFYLKMHTHSESQLSYSSIWIHKPLKKNCISKSIIKEMFWLPQRIGEISIRIETRIKPVSWLKRSWSASICHVPYFYLFVIVLKISASRKFQINK